MATKIATSLTEYLSWVRGFRKRWGVSKWRELWFRAEDTAYVRTHLQPGLYRPRKSGIRKSVRKLLELENDLYEEFQRCATQLSDIKHNDEDWEWDSYFLMQLYGVPTRLLDWSDGALIALHFAVRDKPRPATSGSIVYVLDPHWLVGALKEDPEQKSAKNRWREYCKQNPESTDEEEWDRLYLPEDEDDARDPLMATPKIPILWDLPHLTRRVAAQRSRFMIFGTDPLWLSDVWRRGNSPLASLTIPAGAITKIRNELTDAGITESVVYPDLDGLGRELKQKWEARR